MAYEMYAANTHRWRLHKDHIRREFNLTIVFKANFVAILLLKSNSMASFSHLMTLEVSLTEICLESHRFDRL